MEQPRGSLVDLEGSVAGMVRAALKEDSDSAHAVCARCRPKHVAVMASKSNKQAICAAQSPYCVACRSEPCLRATARWWESAA